MRNLRLGVLCSVLFVTACASLSPDSPGRPNSTSSMQSTQQNQPKDPHDFVSDPTIGSNPPSSAPAKPLCRLQCSPTMHCDNSGFVERCVSDEKQKP
jgi:hypothetical protein